MTEQYLREAVPGSGPNLLERQTSGLTLRICLGAAVFLVIAVIGLYHVKWHPYYEKSFVAAIHHNIGNSILMGKAASAPSPSWHAAWSYSIAYGKAIWEAIVLGLLLGSAVQVLIPQHWILRAFGGRGFGSVVAAGLCSTPGMMCTCCGAPVVVGLRARQASPGAAIAFWLGNPVLNPATLVFIAFVLGWQWMVLRLGLGVLLVFGVGYVANKMSNTADEVPLTFTNAPEDGHILVRWLRILGSMTIRLIPEYAILVLALGAARGLLFPHIGPEIGATLPWILAFAVVGTIFVIPTAGEVPIIQAMLALGLAAAPAATLLMTLPSVSLPSLAMVWRAFPKRVLAMTCGAVFMSGLVAAGFALWFGF